jgi:uncharacterized protein YjbJ (UPF0337 family)
MFTLFRNIFFIALLVGGVYFVANYGGGLKNQALSMVGLSDGDVKGASTKKAEEVSGKISNDVENQLDVAKDQALNMRVSDALNAISRFQRVPKDFNSISGYVQDQMGNMLQSREQKGKGKEKIDK